MKTNRGRQELSPQEKRFEEASRRMEAIPGLDRVWRSVCVRRGNDYPMAREDWAYVTGDGSIYVNPRRDASPAEWVYILSHCCLHLALGHIQPERQNDPLWEKACNCAVAKYLAESKIGTPPAGFDVPPPAHVREEGSFWDWLNHNSHSQIPSYSTMSGGRPDMRPPEREDPRRQAAFWADCFSEGLRWNLTQAVREAGGLPRQTGYEPLNDGVRQAKEWFVSSYPLLGAIAAGFKLVTDEAAVNRLRVPVAAVSSRMQEIYVNPKAKLTQQEWRFVLAHEFLHAALRHDVRCGDREPELWNVACDFVINLWLREMGVGEMPEGLLYDEQFRNMSAEAVYGQLVLDLRYYRGLNPADLLYDSGGWACDEAEALDDYYRRAIQRGLEYHTGQGRGYLPAGLAEEIRALAVPPIPWDVKLARWFDERFQPLEPRRTYARLSRRQSACPDIPRPAWRTPEEPLARRTFGVVLDTSGSMDRHLLAQALGAIASYSEARDVSAVRVVFCDAAPYDQGMMRPEDIAGSVRVLGRGGTRLQPGIDLLEADPKFPREAPLLVITDGGCGRLNLRGRDHAYLLPRGRYLPFPPKGTVFQLK
ncbi:MAG: peptidase [Oscillospiraceae bacterium]|nr:peptidase [Oscillospiraceae bacterium]